MYCPKCGAALDEDALYCGECGTIVEAKTKRFCGKCGAELPVGGTVCTRCGNGAKPAKKPTNKKLIAIAAAGIALLVLIAIIASSSKKSPKPSNNPSSDHSQVVYTEEPEGMIAMISVVDMTYDEALMKLQSLGFTNIVSNIDDDSEQREYIVIMQSVWAGEKLLPDDKIRLTCACKCKLDLSISSEINLLFNKYDMSISLDGKEIGSVSNGDTFTYNVEVLSGEHELSICKLGETKPICYRTITISGDTSYSCDVAHGDSLIEIKNETITNIEKLVMVDVTEMVLSEAMGELQEKGFSNVREEPNNSIWDKNNWIVVSQSIEAGTLTDSNAFIQLDCIKLDKYFSDALVGKDIDEIEQFAAAHGISLVFVDKYSNNMDDRVAAMKKEEKENWIATDAKQYIFAYKTASVTIEPESEAMASPTPNAESTEDGPVYYSTNDHETAREGNSGVFAYKEAGNSYDVYYIIDFDEGYVYYFTDGNGEVGCQRSRIESGDLNSVLITTYHEAGEVWSYGLHFKWKRNPYTLIVEDEDGFEWTYSPTFLEDALRIRDKKTIVDY